MRNEAKRRGENGLWRRLHQTNTIWKAAVAAGLSWDAAKLIGSKHPFFAPLAAILCLQVTVEDSVIQAIQRIIGIVTGVVLADLLVQSIGVHDWSIMLIVLLGLGLGTWFKMGDKAVSQIGVSALLVLTAGPVRGDLNYGTDRIVETVVGALIAILMNMLIVPPDFTRDAEDNVAEASAELADCFKAAADWLKSGADCQAMEGLSRKTERLLDDVSSYQQHVDEAKKAIKFSPLLRPRRKKLLSLGKQMAQLEAAYVHALEMLEIAAAWRTHAELSEPNEAVWGERFMLYSDTVLEWNRGMALGSLPKLGKELMKRGGENRASAYDASLTLASRQFLEDLYGREQESPPASEKGAV